MKKISNLLKSIWKDESAQGATEYILLLVVVVAIGMIFKDKLKEIVEQKLGTVGSDIGAF